MKLTELNLKLQNCKNVPLPGLLEQSQRAMRG